MLSRSASSRSSHSRCCGPSRPGSACLGQREVEVGVAAANGLAVAARRQTLERVLADGLEHPEARLVAALSCSVVSRLLRRSDSTPSRTSRSGSLGDGLGGAEREPADEDAEAREELLLLAARGARSSTRSRARSVHCRSVTPEPGAAPAGDRASSRDARAARAARAALQRAAASSSASGSPSRRTQSSTTDAAFVLGELEVGPGRPSAIDEQPDRLGPPQPGERRAPRRVGQLERRHPVDPLLGNIERSTARDEHLHAGRAGEQLADERRRGEHVLEVVEQQQRLPVAQVLEQRLARRSVPAARLTPSSSAIALATSRASVMRRELDEHDAVGTRPRDAPVTSSASRVFPDPAAPVNVRSRTSSRRRSSRISRSSRVRPTNDDERRCRLGRGRVGTGGRRLGGDEVERRILVEDRALELPERERRLDAERLDERRASHRGTPRARPPAFPSGRARA